MKRMAILALLLCFAPHSWPQRFDPFKGPPPVAILIQTDPWLMAIGSDLPRVAIYETGQVIYMQRNEKSAFYAGKVLTANELANIKIKLASFGNYSGIKKHYNLAPNVTDQPETKIYLELNGKTIVTTVYGLIAPGTRLAGQTVFPSARRPDKLPEELQKLYEYLITLKFGNAREWKPKYIEVIIWDYSYAPQKSIHWPKDWPGLSSPQTIKHGNAYSIFMPSEELPRLQNFLKTEKEKGAVEIDGRKWAASVRYTFPSEPVWRKAFQSND